MKDGPPADFGLRYILWYVFWKNAITVLMLTQAAFSAVLALVPATSVNDKTFHWLLITNAVLCAILAQIKRDGSPPKRSKK
jgi:hypothetical protein